MSDALLRSTVFKVLLSHSVVRMDFRAHGMHVIGGNYGMVWYYIWDGVIKVREANDVRVETRIPADAGAMYSRPQRTIWFPRDTYGATPLEKARIVHECTHALRHILFSPAYFKEGGPRHDSNISGQLRFDNEAVAFIAGSLYHIYETQADWPVVSDDPAGPIYEEANAIAHTLMGKPGATADDEAFTNLRDTISKCPPYKERWTLVTLDKEGETWQP